MKIDLRSWLPAIVAAVLLALIAGPTVVAFERSGRWSFERKPKFEMRPNDPYQRLEMALSEPDRTPELAGMRNPFEFGRVAVARPVHPTGPSGPPSPPQRSRPTLTAIISDPSESRAVVVYEGRNYSVRVGDLFAEYKVVSISPDGVVLDDGRERLVLQRPTKGR